MSARTVPAMLRAGVGYAVATAALAVIGVVSTAGCAGTPDKARLTEIVAPSRTEFVGTPTGGGVSEFLEVRCGSLDCHGTIGRPMRIYSGRGLRLPTDPPASTNSSGTSTDERNANYDSVIGVQPEEMSRVAASGGQNPERIYIVSKARGDVAHKGGAIVARDDDGDLCLTSWLTTYFEGGQTNFAACKRASTL